jgi:hypothetical protein
MDARSPRRSRDASEHTPIFYESAAFVYALAGTFFVLIVTVGTHLTMGVQFFFVWSLWWGVIHAWPIPLCIGLVSGTNGTGWAKLMGSYALVFVAVSAISLALYEDLDIAYLGSNALSMLLIAIPVAGLLYRPIRAVGMLVFTFMLIVLAVSPALAFTTLQQILALSSGDSLWRLPALLLLSMLRPEGLMAFIALSVAVFVGVLGWWVLRRIGRAYQRKQVSDQALMLNSLWAVVALSHVSSLSTQQGYSGADWAWIVFPIAAFGSYWLLVQAGLAVQRRARDSRHVAPVLLFLRVFSLGKRSERLFHVLTSQWLRQGSLALIAGPDLATKTVQPNQFLEYLARRLRHQFVKDEADLNRRLAELDLNPDPDGRYRVNQFFCFADTWKSAIRRLARRVDMVLMDLRSFSPDNLGCLYELEQLFEHVSLNRVVLLIDDETDWPYLEGTLKRLWANAHDSSPGCAVTSSRLRVFRIERASSREVNRIIQMVTNDGALLRGRSPIRTG